VGAFSPIKTRKARAKRGEMGGTWKKAGARKKEEASALKT